MTSTLFSKILSKLIYFYSSSLQLGSIMISDESIFILKGYNIYKLLAVLKPVLFVIKRILYVIM